LCDGFVKREKYEKILGLISSSSFFVLLLPSTGIAGEMIDKRKKKSFGNDNKMGIIEFQITNRVDGGKHGFRYCQSRRSKDGASEFL
jgi:hypothetical protein